MVRHFAWRTLPFNGTRLQAFLWGLVQAHLTVHHGPDQLYRKGVHEGQCLVLTCVERAGLVVVKEILFQ